MPEEPKTIWDKAEIQSHSHSVLQLESSDDMTCIAMVLYLKHTNCYQITKLADI